MASLVTFYKPFKRLTPIHLKLPKNIRGGNFLEPHYPYTKVKLRHYKEREPDTNISDEH
jgi:hypothetical protein